MDGQILVDIADTVSRIKMFPYFDMAHYALMCMAIREDTPQTGGPAFSRRHPFASWLASMLMCFSGSILANLLVGEPMVIPLKNHESILLATIVWYVINYSPFDLTYRIGKLLPFKLVICVMKEVQRTKKIYDGVSVAYKLYPNSYLICVLIGVVKGSGYLEMKILERLVRGVWLPASNEFLRPSFTTKACLGVSIFFLLEKMGRVPTPHNQLFLGAVLFLVYFRISSLILGIHDPFVPFENLFCSLFLGGLVDALRRVVEGSPTTQPSPSHHRTAAGATPGATGNQSTTPSLDANSTTPGSGPSSSSVNKSKEEKKNE